MFNAFRSEKFNLTGSLPQPFNLTCLVLSPHSPLPSSAVSTPPLPTADADPVTPDLIFSPHGPLSVSQQAATDDALTAAASTHHAVARYSVLVFPASMHQAVSPHYPSLESLAKPFIRRTTVLPCFL
ncbi:uncharacterized protein DS421_15g496420 [Arachis hypogaea]|nr:uncharacterized protein DS421_15g496420 [Arachis hypogaea]